MLAVRLLDDVLGRGVQLVAPPVAGLLPHRVPDISMRVYVLFAINRIFFLKF